VRYHASEQAIHHFSGVSAFSEHVVVPASAAISVDKRLPLDVLAVVGCAVLTGYGAATNAAGVRIGESALVIGCGGVGLNVIQACRLAGADPIIAVDVADDKLEFARRFGATELVNARDRDVVAEVRRVTGVGTDYAFEAVGDPRLVELSVEAIKPGGTVIVIGAPAADATISIGQLRLLSEEKTIRGSLYGSCNFALDVPSVLQLWEAGKLELQELIVKRCSLTDINAAFGEMEAGQLGRTVVEFPDAATSTRKPS
jgi:Zn-dependent alcohol dehydrogenase